MTEIRIISLWQPFASLVALSLKQYETRSWQTQYRGKLAIHAAKRPFINSKDGIDIKVVDKVADATWLDALRLGYEAGIINTQSNIPFGWNLPLGCIVAIADFTHCQQIVDDPWRVYKGLPDYVYIKYRSELERAVGDWRPKRYAWKLENVRPLNEPIPFKGSQGLRRLNEASTLQAIADQLGDVFGRVA